MRIRAFTLLEILVILAIIGLIIGILLPSVSNRCPSRPVPCGCTSRTQMHDLISRTIEEVSVNKTDPAKAVMARVYEGDTYSELLKKSVVYINPNAVAWNRETYDDEIALLILVPNEEHRIIVFFAYGKFQEVLSKEQALEIGKWKTFEEIPHIP